MSPQPRKPAPTPASRRRTAGIRRPRVAGRPDTGRPDTGRPDAPAEAGESEVRPDVTRADSRHALFEPETAELATPEVDGEAETAAVPATDGTGGTDGMAGTDAGEDVGHPGGPEVDGAAEAGERPAGARARRARRARRERDEAFGRVEEPARRSRRGPKDLLRLPAPPRTKRGTTILAGVTVVALALAVLAGVSWWSMNHTPAARNTALVDVAATTQVSQQLGDAVKTVYSYDYTRLDQNEAAARQVITPEFGQQFDQLFGEVRKLAPQQQAVVTATISQAAVESITGDRAVLMVFLDQQATRAANDQAGQQVAAAGRLTVTGQRVDGTWKIADVAVA
ncbi:hypothetical protein LWC35_06500 [Pseudonocardia kujensis]|uniref:hypothetical protein n=1 Tax=Pseudonocardia kujensis TaxID=1128675 RepID=UPI001E5F6ABB|nr:hypothetical protein [Pseudonocardia kujensis]MCE0762561.1 hypothetical protein [Pseudonocardia kujensis]